MAEDDSSSDPYVALLLSQSSSNSSSATSGVLGRGVGDADGEPDSSEGGGLQQLEEVLLSQTTSSSAEAENDLLEDARQRKRRKKRSRVAREEEESVLLTAASLAAHDALEQEETVDALLEPLRMGRQSVFDLSPGVYELIMEDGTTDQQAELLHFQCFAELAALPADRAPRAKRAEVEAARQAWMAMHTRLREDYENAANTHQKRPWLRSYRVPPSVFDEIWDKVHAVREEVARRDAEGSLSQHAGLAAWTRSTNVPTIILVAGVLRWTGGIPYHAVFEERRVLGTATFYHYLHTIVRVVVAQLGHKVAFPFDDAAANAEAQAFMLGGSGGENSQTYIANTIGACDGYHVRVVVPPRPHRRGRRDQLETESKHGADPPEARMRSDDEHGNRDEVGGELLEEAEPDNLDSGYISAAALIGRDGKPSVNCQVVVNKRAKILYASVVCGGATPDAAALERTILWQSAMRYDVKTAYEQAEQAERSWEVRQDHLQQELQAQQAIDENPTGVLAAKFFDLRRRLNETHAGLRVAREAKRSIQQEKDVIAVEDGDAAAAAAAAGRPPPNIPVWPKEKHLVVDNGYTLRVPLVSPFAELPASAYDTESPLFSKAVLNYNVSRQRQASERVFAIMERKFPRLRWGFEIHISHVPYHFMLSCILHNMCIDALDAEALADEEEFWAREDEHTLRELWVQVEAETRQDRKMDSRMRLLEILQAGAAGFAARGSIGRRVLYGTDGDPEDGPPGDEDDPSEGDSSAESIVETPGPPLMRGEQYQECIKKRLMDLQETEAVDWGRLLPLH